MAQDRINYDDIIDPSIQQRLDELSATIQGLTKELTELKTATAQEESTNEDFNESLRDSIEVAEDLLRLTQEEIVLKKNLEKTQKKLDAALEEGSITADEYSLALKIGKEELSKMGFQLKNNTKLTLANKGSMTELSLQLAKNRMKYRDLTKEERENEKVGIKLLKTIQRQDKEIKKLDKSIGNAQRNVGNYTKAMGKASRSSKKFGATLSALVVGTMVASAKELQVAADFMSTGVNLAVAAVGNMQKLAKGEISFSEAFDLAGIYEIAKALTLVSKEAQFLQALENKRYTDVRFQIEQQKVLREDEAVGFQKRFTAASNINELLNVSDQIITDSFEKRKKEFTEILDNDKENIAAQTGLLNLETEKNNKLRENEVQRREALRAEIRLKKDLANLYKEENQLILEQTLLQEIIDNNSLQRIRSNMKERFDITQAGLRDQLELEEKYSDDFWAIWLEIQGNAVDFQRSMADINAEIAQRNLDTFINVAQTGLSIASSVAGDNKDLQFATAIINTFAGVAQALASAPPPYNFIQAGLVLAAGLANAAKLSNTDVPSYAVGTDAVPETGMALIHEKERILPSHINKQLGNIPNDQVPGLINLGLKMPQLQTGINELVGLQRESNKIVSRWAYFDKNGNKFDLNGNVTYYN